MSDVKLETIEESYESYSKAIFGTLPFPEVQKRETEKAFYAGAWAVMCTVKGIGEDSVPDEVGIRHLQEMEETLKEFTRKMIRSWRKGRN